VFVGGSLVESADYTSTFSIRAALSACGKVPGFDSTSPLHGEWFAEIAHTISV